MISQDLTCNDFHAKYYFVERPERGAQSFELLRGDGQNLTREALAAIRSQYGDDVSYTEVCGRIFVEA